jgi:predicted nucleotidyltransferase
MSLLKGLSDKEVKQVIPDRCVLLGFRGSIAHDMYVPNTDPNSIDDKDIMGVFIPPLDHYFGLKNQEHQEVFLREWDSVCYEMRKFMRLLLKSNPNVIGLLWLEKKHYIKVEAEGQALIDARELFSTKQIYHSFTGYAYGQLHRMTHQAFEGYMGDKRKKLVEKFGYDTKNAAHLIRLLRMGIEFLREGVLYVARKDRQQLLEIKRGEWTLDQVKAEADHLFKRAETAYDESKLPNSPDFEKVNRLLVDILKGSSLIG